MEGKEPLPMKDFEKKDGHYLYHRPDTGYLSVDVGDGFVYPLEFAPRPYGFLDSRVNYKGRLIHINDALKDLGQPGLLKRVPIVGYGSNASPFIQMRKFKKRKISVPAPTFKGFTRDFDVVFGSYVSRAGSIAAQIVPSDETQPEVWVNLLDEDQIKAIYQSEKIREDGKGNYLLGLMKFIFTAEDGSELATINAYGYFGSEKPTFIDPETEEPVAFASSEYRGQDGTLVAHRDFVPIDAKKGNFQRELK